MPPPPGRSCSPSLLRRAPEESRARARSPRIRAGDRARAPPARGVPRAGEGRGAAGGPRRGPTRRGASSSRRHEIKLPARRGRGGATAGPAHADLEGRRRREMGQGRTEDERRRLDLRRAGARPLDPPRAPAAQAARRCRTWSRAPSPSLAQQGKGGRRGTPRPPAIGRSAPPWPARRGREGGREREKGRGGRESGEGGGKKVKIIMTRGPHSW